MTYFFEDITICFDSTYFELQADWWVPKGDKFRSIVVSVEKCKPRENRTCVSESDREQWF